MKTFISQIVRQFTAIFALGLLSPCLAPLAQAQVTNGLILYYKLDGNANDSSPSGNNGTPANVVWTNSIVSPGFQAAVFNGSSSYIQGATLLPNLTSASISVWIFVTSAPTSQQMVFFDGDTLNGQDFALKVGPGRLITFVTKDDQLVTTTNLPFNQWFHIAAVADATSDKLQLWVGGVVETNKTWTGSANIDHHYYPQVGRLAGGSTQIGNYFAGSIDDVRVYDRALSASEIGQIVASGSLLVRGSISYMGTQPGPIIVLATTNASSWSTNFSTQLPAPSDYAIGLPGGLTNLWLRAFRDLNGNGTNDPFEAQGEFPGNPIFATNTPLTDINILLIDPDTDADGLPDWWEWNYFGNITNASPSATNAPDHLTNLQEYQAGTSPLLPDTDEDGMPDWWELQYGLNPIEYNISFASFGDGSDGDLSVSIGQTNFTDSVWSSVIGTNTPGSTLLSVASTNGFGTNDCVLIITMQDGNTNFVQNVAGTYEFERVAGVSNATLILSKPLKNAFVTSTSKQTQIIRVPQYNSVSVDGVLTCRPWNGTNGGILAFFANSISVSAGGMIIADGKGYRGGLSVPSGVNYEYGIAGECTTHRSLSRETNSLERAQGGGGAGRGADGSGGGGAYGENGTDGAGGTDYGRGASSFGTANLERLYMGGGGGGSGSHDSNRPGVGGGAGGGIIFIGAASCAGSGFITCNGFPGQNGVRYTDNLDSGAGGGGGAGGIIYLIGGIGTNLQIQARGGLGGTNAAGSNGKPGGNGGGGRIRFDTINSNLWPSSTPFVGYLGQAGSNTNLLQFWAYSDTDNDGLNDYQEFVEGTNPTNSDTDGDGMPDGWEVTNGTQPTVPDADGDVDGDGLSNGLEYRLGTKANNSDSDRDGISDYDEYAVYGTNPTTNNTDGDGIPDKWEIENNLNPLVNDANGDRDLDGLSNLQEYQIWLTNGVQSANSADSVGDGMSDFERFYGKKTVKHYYDKNDRLIGSEFNHGAAGLSLAYIYDGNGNITNQVYLSRDANTNGLPDLWEYLNALTNNTSASVDSDGDGWSDYQEWKSGSDPHSASSTPTTPALAFEWPFSPSNMVMAVGQLDGIATPEEIAVSGSGVSPGGSNIVIVARYSDAGWTNETIPIGDLNVESVVVGQVTNRPGPAIYLGVQEANGLGGILEIFPTESGWQQTMVSEFTSPFVDLAGISPNNTLLGSFSPYGAGSEMLHETWPEGGIWRRRVLDPNVSQALGTATLIRHNNSAGSYVVREVATNALGIASPSAIFDDFEDNVINTNLWSISGTKLDSAGWACNQSGGQLHLLTTLSSTHAGVDSASVKVVTSNLWSMGCNSAVIRISRLGFTTHFSGRNYSSDIGVLLGNAYLYRYQTNGTTGIDDSHNNCVIHLFKFGTNAYARFCVNGSSWTAWIPLGTSSGILTFSNTISSPGGANPDAQSLLDVESISFASFGAISYSVGANDLSQPAAGVIFEDADGRWLIKSRTNETWFGLEKWTAETGGSLVKISSLQENDKIQTMVSTNCWIGAYWNGITASWTWSDGSSLTFSNWAIGEPSFNGEGTAVYMMTNGTWAVGNNTLTLPGVMQSEPSWIATIITNCLNTDEYQGSRASLVAAKLDPLDANNLLVLNSSIRDTNANGTLGVADYVTNQIFALNSGPNAVVATASIGFDHLNSTPTVSSALVKLTNSVVGTLFTAAPDGRVYSWLINDPLMTASLFSDVHHGFAWQALSGHRMNTLPQQGLIGLRTSRIDPRQCALVYWPPSAVMPASETVPQSVPVARLLQSQATDADTTAIAFRVWDDGGQSCLPMLEWSTNGGVSWFTATLEEIDGQPYSPTLRLSSSPEGISHTLIWNTHTDIPGYVGDVLLRARATGTVLTGDWSEPVANTVNDTANLNATQTDSSDPIESGASLTYTITVTNGGPSTAFAVNVADTLPGSVSFLSATSERGSFNESGGVVGFTLGDLTNSESATLTVTVSPSAAGFITNLVVVSASSTDPNTADNSCIEITAVNSSEQLTVLPPSIDLGSVWVGASGQGNFTLTNSGLTPITGTASITGGDFSIFAGGSFSVPALGTATVTASFHPQGIGQQTAEVIFISNGGNRTNSIAGLGIQSALASFEGSPTNGMAPLAVTFTDLSSGSITNRTWKFGDGQSLVTTNTTVNHIYACEGIYTVSLSVGGIGGIITDTKNGYVTATYYPPGDVNGDSRVNGADSLLMNQVLYELRGTNHPVFSVTGFGNGDVNQDGAVTSADPYLINQVMVGLRPYVVSKAMPNARTNSQPIQVIIYGVGFPTNDVTGVEIGSPVDLPLSNITVLSPEKIRATVPAGGGIGAGAVRVLTSNTNGVISTGTFNNQ